MFMTLAGLGYMFNQRRRPGDEVDGGEQRAPAVSSAADLRDRPSATSQYENRYLEVVRAEEARLATAMAEKASRPQASRVIPRGTFKDPHASTVGGGGASASTAPGVVRSMLTGMDIPVEHFSHNNMVPFYGGSVKQSLDPEAHSSRLSSFTGVDDVARPMGRKEAQKPMFDPAQQDVHGVRADQVMQLWQSHIEAPVRRHNERPFEQVIVGKPEVRGGETGDVYFDIREHQRGKTVDEMRAANNPKQTYEGRVLPGGAATVERPQPAALVTHRAPLIREQRGVDDMLRTTGAYTRDRVRPDVEARETWRQGTTAEYFGAAGHGVQHAPEARPTPRAPLRVGTLGAPSLGPSVSTVKGVTDYGRASIAVYANERDVTTTRVVQGTFASVLRAMVAPLQDAVRPTRKQETFLHAPRAFGNLGGVMPAKMTVHDCDDVLRTTIKEATMSEAPMGNLRGPAALTVYDPDDIARVTGKETGLSEAPRGNLRGGFQAAPVYDPDASRPRTTVKETALEETPLGNLRGAPRATVYDPDDVLRTTTKEVNLFDSTGAASLAPVVRRPQAAPQDGARVTGRNTMDAVDTVRNPGATRAAGLAYDPDDWRPDVTLKQVATDSGRGDHVDGNVGGAGGGGYATAEATAPATHRQYTSDVGPQYGGAGTRERAEGGHGVTLLNTDAKDTHRQSTSAMEYFGAVGSSTPAARLHDDVDAATVRSTREVIAEGRQPTPEAGKVAAGAAQMGGTQRAPQRAFDGAGAYEHVMTQGTQERPERPPDADRMGAPTQGRQAYEQAGADRLDDQAFAVSAQRDTNAVAVPSWGG